MQPGEGSATDTTAAFWEWVDGYVCSPHPEIGRDGPVCPFLPKVVEEGELRLEIDGSLDGRNPAAMEKRMRAAVDAFESMALPPWLKALVVVFPEVAGDDVAVVDEVQAALKPDCVRRGLMVGQFHPLSMEPGARNAEFMANRAPFAAIAVRHMSHHDIVFLDRSAEMFREYESRFGEKMASGDVLDPFLVERYESAAARFTTS